MDDVEDLIGMHTGGRIDADGEERDRPLAAAELVPGAHRTIRRLERSDSPYAGVLIADGDRQRVRVDASDVDAVLWDLAGAQHVAGVRDIVREAGGQAAVLPWCVEPVEVFLARRAAAQRPLSVGEAVTLVGSLLRGIAEMGGRSVGGRWWLDDSCRPLFVPGDGPSCGQAAITILERLRQDGTDRALERVLARICAGAEDHRVVQRSMDGWERELTDLAAPRALERDVHAPERVRTIPLHRSRLPQVEPDGRREHRSMRERLVRLWASALERVRPLNPRRISATDRSGEATDARRPRGRMLLVGVAAASAVLIVGLLWPGGGDDAVSPRAVAADDGTATAATGEPEDAAQEEAEREQRRDSASPDSSDEPDASRPVRDEGDVTDAAVRLLTRIDDCRNEEDTACAEAAVPGGGAVIQERLGQDASERDATLIEDYGDVAVIRLAAGAETGEQMLVIVRTDAGWLVRDVYDVADQPSGSG
ncbi:hypothetical protein [Microbacterium suwonense]|uniref:Uncharacterized protein n=1 Tax=Microbacterium suwonense TaxID=683047 RepID=A0ABM8FRV3_9MICO|nr:hypothetical protein [Microbacterium suwonense]BDZ38176.1 hypothetical protein GCM10025863_07900 [Microbacterium suwonense]